MTRKLQTCKCKSNPNQKLQRNQPLCLLVLVVPNNKKANPPNKRKTQQPKNLLHFSICACHPCAGAVLIFSVLFQFYRMIPKGIQALLLTGAPGCPIESATGSRELGAVQPGPQLRPAKSYSLQNKTDVLERQGNRTAKTNKRTNEFRDKPTSN